MEFDCDHFDPANPILRTLQSRQVASEKLIEDFETAHTDGEIKLKAFLQERMFSGMKQFDATVHINSSENFSNPPELKDKLAASKSVFMENRAMENVISLSLQSDVKIHLTQKIMHRITDSCLSIFNVNGNMVKVQKSKLVEKLDSVPLVWNNNEKKR